MHVLRGYMMGFSNGPCGRLKSQFLIKKDFDKLQRLRSQAKPRSFESDVAGGDMWLAPYDKVAICLLVPKWGGGGGGAIHADDCAEQCYIFRQPLEARLHNCASTIDFPFLKLLK